MAGPAAGEIGRTCGVQAATVLIGKRRTIRVECRRSVAPGAWSIARLRSHVAAHHRPVGGGQFLRHRRGRPVRTAARRRPCGVPLSRTRPADPAGERIARTAARCGRPRALPAALSIRAARQVRHPVHAGSYGARAIHPGIADRRRAEPSRHAGHLARLRRRPAGLRRKPPARAIPHLLSIVGGWNL